MKNTSKYVNNIHNLFITIVLIYTHTNHIFFYSKLKWKKQKVLLQEQIKAIQEGLVGFILGQVVYWNGQYYYDRKLVPNRDED
jgi:hypothetical protein